jgi:uncharacterized membrane protein
MDATRDGTAARDRVAEIRLEIEAARERIVETIDALEYKADVPSRLADGLSATASSVTARLLDRIPERKAKRMERDMSRQMETLEETIDVEAPRAAAYNQWTQFEEFPRFMEGVESVIQVDDEHVHWIADVAGVRKEWDAQITRQVPDQEIDWVGLGAPDNRGRVVFADIPGGGTRITMMLDYEPEGPVEKVGDALGLVRRRVQGDMQRFKGFIEERGRETGGWRGEIHADDEHESDEAVSATTRAGSNLPNAAGRRDDGTHE